MHINPNADHPEWGIKINPAQHYASVADYPAWLNWQQREDWGRRGVVVWSKAQQQVTYWQGRQVLRVLEELRRDEAWQRSRMTLGRPVVRLKLPVEDRRKRGSKQAPPPAEPAAEPEHVLVNTINLTGEQMLHLFTVLQAAEEDLRRVAAAEERAEREILGKVVALILADDRDQGA